VNTQLPPGGAVRVRFKAGRRPTANHHGRQEDGHDRAGQRPVRPKVKVGTSERWTFSAQPTAGAIYLSQGRLARRPGPRPTTNDGVTEPVDQVPDDRTRWQPAAQKPGQGERGRRAVVRQHSGTERKGTVRDTQVAAAGLVGLHDRHVGAAGERGRSRGTQDRRLMKT